MNKTIIALLALTAAIPASIALACTPDAKHGIMPENNMNIPVSQFASGTMSEADFNLLNDRATKYYTPVFAAQGRTYKIIANWTDGTVNAYANRSGNVSEVHMFGGLARHPKMTIDGFALVICHETGHHLGGAPKISGIFGGSKWASNEGAADYYATLKCSRFMWKDDDNASIVAKLNVPSSVVASCQKSFNAPADISLCERAAMAGKDLGDTLADMGKTAPTDFEKPDTSVVNKTNDAHPEAQCRLDTYYNGAICSVAADVALSDTDASVGSCSEEKDEVVGIRPRCWYKPASKGDTGNTGSKWPLARK